MKLIVGLGNPGSEYNHTRHNVGFMIIDNYCQKNNLECNNNKFNGLYVQTIINGEKVVLLKPQKYMNLSGEVVRDFVKFFKIDIQDILIIHDDLDINLGNYKLKSKGSSGGHNGLKNIQNNLQTTEYKRLKIGISNNKQIETKDYVLGKFTIDEKKILNSIILTTENIITDFLIYKFDILMTKYNNN